MERRKRKSEAADIGIVGALTFARHDSSRSVSLLIEIGFHLVERRHAALQFVDAKALQAQQRIARVSSATTFPSAASMILLKCGITVGQCGAFVFLLFRKASSCG